MGLLWSLGSYDQLAKPQSPVRLYYKAFQSATSLLTRVFLNDSKELLRSHKSPTFPLSFLYDVSGNFWHLTSHVDKALLSQNFNLVTEPLPAIQADILSSVSVPIPY